jgi:hypothetical protein
MAGDQHREEQTVSEEVRKEQIEADGAEGKGKARRR